MIRPCLFEVALGGKRRGLVELGLAHPVVLEAARLALLPPGRRVRALAALSFALLLVERSAALGAQRSRYRD